MGNAKKDYEYRDGMYWYDEPVTMTTNRLSDNNFPSNQFNDEEKRTTSGINAQWLPSGLYIPDLGGRNISVHDGFNNQAINVITTHVQHFSDLPKTAPNGYLVKITGEGGSDDDYYVRYDSEQGVWKEAPAGGVEYNFYYETLPYALTRQPDGAFLVSAIGWAGREVGDEDSNPQPSFIGQQINDIFFYRNRLGMIAGENVCLSKSGDFFNFWMDSATGVSDTDPIDLTVSTNSIATLESAVPFNQDLFLFSRDNQFVLRAEGALSPKTAQLGMLTAFTNDTGVHPINVGRNLYYTTERANHSSVREYFTVSDGSGDMDSTDITSHVPNYIPKRVRKLISCGNENLIIALTDGDRQSMYVYKYLYAGEAKVQSSWSKWTFSGTIIDAEFIDSTLYIVMYRRGYIVLERMDISFNTKDFDDEPYRILLDGKKVVTNMQQRVENQAYARSGEYVELWITTLMSSFLIYEGGKWDTNKHGIPCLVFPDGRMFEAELEYNNEGNLTKPPYFLINPDDDIPDTAYVGIKYPMEIVFSPFFIKKVDQQGTSPMDNYRLIIQKLKVDYSNSGEFMAYVNSTGKPQREYKFTGRIVGYDTNRLGIHPVETGTFSIPVHGTNTETKVKLINDSPMPSTFIGYTWQGNVTHRFRQI